MFFHLIASLSTLTSSFSWKTEEVCSFKTQENLIAAQFKDPKR